jgi:putative ABC transport system permease protein
MNWWNRLWRKAELEERLDAELRFHFDYQVRDNIQSGMNEEEARRRARLEFGSIDAIKEQCGEASGTLWVESTLRDLSYGLRLFYKDLGFATVAALTLALGIGANTAMFSFAKLLLNRPVSLPQLDRLMSVSVVTRGSDERLLAAANYIDLRARTKSLKSIAAYEEWAASVQGQNGPEDIHGVRVSEGFFATLAAEPAQGRVFLDEEHQPGHQQVVILSHALWQSEFGGDSHVLGRALRLGGENYEIVGVMPPTFQFPLAGQQFWAPLALNTAERSERAKETLATVGRLKDGTTLEGARAEMETLWAQLQRLYPKANRERQLTVVSLRAQLVDGDSRAFVILLLFVAGFVLLIACVNVANLQLSRAGSRRREIAIRVALGATRIRLIRQLLTESVVLAMIGGALGLLLAVWGVGLLRTNMPEQVRRICDITGLRLDVQAFIFMLFVAVASGVLSGLAPALKGSRADLRDCVETGGGRIVGGGKRLQTIFVVSEVILSVVLLIGAGLMVKGFSALANHNLGWEPQSLVAFHVNLSSSQYAGLRQRITFYEKALDRINSLPTVQGVGAASGVPYSFYENEAEVISDAKTEVRSEQLPIAMQESITNDYFRVMHIPLLEGRYFDQRDGDGPPAVGIVSESMARRLWPGRDVVGRRVKLVERDADPEWITVVGVAADIRHEVYDRTFRSVFYRPMEQAPDDAMDFIVRSSGEPKQLFAMVHSAISEIDKDQPVTHLQTMTQKITDQASALHLVAALMGLFGLVAVVLSATGIYGVITYSVTERKREIGIRMALGAQKAKVVKMVMGEGVLFASLGGAIGIGFGWFLARLLSSLLYGVQAWDLAVYAGVPALLLLVSIVATAMPALRAVQVDPVMALRYE